MLFLIETVLKRIGFSTCVVRAFFMWLYEQRWLFTVLILDPGANATWANLPVTNQCYFIVVDVGLLNLLQFWFFFASHSPGLGGTGSNLLQFPFLTLTRTDSGNLQFRTVRWEEWLTILIWRQRFFGCMGSYTCAVSFERSSFWVWGVRVNKNTESEYIGQPSSSTHLPFNIIWCHPTLYSR